LVHQLLRASSSLAVRKRRRRKLLHKLKKNPYRRDYNLPIHLRKNTKE